MEDKKKKLRVNIDQRVKREAVEYPQVIENRQTFCKIVSFANAYSDVDVVASKIKEYLSRPNNKIFLEIGSTTWFKWLENNNLFPSKIHAINITEKELEKGKRLAVNANNKPIFHIMDAHKLSFDDEIFDVVFGEGILHHLDLPVALNEIKRVLKPDGISVFLEPLNINPFSKIFRYFTPLLRTSDEEAFGFKQLALLKDTFSVSYFFPSQLTVVPLGVLSKLFFKRPKNPLTYFGSKVDDFMLRFFPFIKFFYRKMLIVCSR